jgi:MoxR-like ATPase
MFGLSDYWATFIKRKGNTMNEDESDALLDELLASEATSDIESEITEIIRTVDSGSEKINRLAALVKRTNDPTAIDALVIEVYAQGEEPAISSEDDVRALLRAAAELANHPVNKLTHQEQRDLAAQRVAAHRAAVIADGRDPDFEPDFMTRDAIRDIQAAEHHSCDVTSDPAQCFFALAGRPCDCPCHKE